jgi:hypothetical protein
MKYTPENGIRILARMIAEAYLEELDQETLKKTSIEKKEEDCDANQRCDRSGEAAPSGQDKAGD